LTVDFLWRSMIPNQISARLSHHLEVGVKWMGYAGRHGEQGITGPGGPTLANALARRSALTIGVTESGLRET